MLGHKCVIPLPEKKERKILRMRTISMKLKFFGFFCCFFLICEKLKASKGSTGSISIFFLNELEK